MWNYLEELGVDRFLHQRNDQLPADSRFLMVQLLILTERKKFQELRGAVWGLGGSVVITVSLHVMSKNSEKVIVLDM